MDAMRELTFTDNVDHSTQMLSGGALTVENVNVVKNSGSFNTATNASISTFSPNLLNSFLIYPTVMFDGTISSTMPIGTTIYSTLVSPALMKSTSITRIANFATNFRQWCGSMTIRMIFTKPIFVQTKVIASFIPGISEDDIDNITIADMYGAQYHVVMNPDNDNELEFKIPFISGRNWLNMSQSTGVFIVKLFQPLIASQPTGVVNVSVPFTLTLSSNNATANDGERLMPINFRYLVAPTFGNQILQNDYREILINSISPQIKNVATDKYAGFIPILQSESCIAKSLVLLPRSKINDFYNQKYISINNDTDFRSTPNSLDSSRDLIFTNQTLPIYPPFVNTSITGRSYVKVVHTYVDIVPSLALNLHEYTLDSQSQAVRILFCSNLQVAPIGTYNASALTFKNTNPVQTEITLKGTMTMQISFNNGNYNYLIQSTDSSTSIGSAETIDFTYPISFVAFPTTASAANYNQQLHDMDDILVADRGSQDATHVLLVSSNSKSDTQAQIEKGNYSNLVVASQDQMSASFADRALSTSSLVSGYETGQRIDVLTLLMLLKTGVDVVARVSRIASDVLSYVIPIFQANGRFIGPNQVVIFDLTGPQATYFEIDNLRSDIGVFPDITNPQIDVFNIE